MILDSFRQDIRVGLRLLFKDKMFCFLAVLVLGLGIGGATTQFTIVNAIVLRGRLLLSPSFCSLTNPRETCTPVRAKKLWSCFASSMTKA